MSKKLEEFIIGAVFGILYVTAIAMAADALTSPGLY